MESSEHFQSARISASHIPAVAAAQLRFHWEISQKHHLLQNEKTAGKVYMSASVTCAYLHLNQPKVYGLSPTGNSEQASTVSTSSENLSRLLVTCYGISKKYICFHDNLIYYILTISIYNNPPTLSWHAVHKDPRFIPFTLLCKEENGGSNQTYIVLRLHLLYIYKFWGPSLTIINE